LTNLAGLLLEVGRLDEAERTIGQLLERYRGFGQGWSLHAALALARRDPAAARRSLKIAIDCDPMSETSRQALASLTRRAATGTTVDVDLPKGAVVSLADHLIGGAGRVIADIAHALAGHRPSAVVTSEEGEAAGEGFADELRELGVPIVVVRSEDDARRALRSLEPVAVLHHLAGIRFPSPLRVSTERWIAIGHSMLPMGPGYDAYVTLSSFQAQFQTHLDGRVVRIPNGVDLGRFPVQPRPPARRPLTIVALGRLAPGKFPYRLLDHLPDLEALDARLLIAGRGPRRWELEPEIARRGLDDRVQFAGPIRSRDVPAFLVEADVGLHLTEIAEEVHSLTILEMLAAQLPIVSQPRGCLPELVADGVNGFLAEEESSVAAALAGLLESPGLRHDLGAASRDRAEIYSIEHMHVRYRALIEKIGTHHG
jgi:glycosyltransferase involved in cell wall biosynthesis